jgi:hypothetical protein
MKHLAQTKKIQTDSAYIYKKYWSIDGERREKLMPLCGLYLQKDRFGNRALGNKVNNANPYWFSYPGYNEIMTGYADTLINSNHYLENPNVTV